MNYLDIIIAVPLLYGIIKGFTNGLINEVVSLLVLILGVYVAITFSENLAPKVIEVLGGYEEFATIIAFCCLFLVSAVSLKLLGKLMDKLTKALALGIVSRIFGGIFGGLKIVVILSFLLLFVKEYKLIDKKMRKDSVLIQPLTSVSDFINPEIKKRKTTISEKIKKTTQKAKERLSKDTIPE